MKNREKILNTNLYDLLLKMNDRLGCETCIIALISEEEITSCSVECEECIQEWLNAEVKNERWRT